MLGQRAVLALFVHQPQHRSVIRCTKGFAHAQSSQEGAVASQLDGHCVNKRFRICRHSCPIKRDAFGRYECVTHPDPTFAAQRTSDTLHLLRIVDAAQRGELAVQKRNCGGSCTLPAQLTVTSFCCCNIVISFGSRSRNHALLSSTPCIGQLRELHCKHE